MQPLEFVSLTCPHCGAHFDAQVDLSTLPASYVEDCQTCCAPIVVTASMEGGALCLQTRREND